MKHGITTVGKRLRFARELAGLGGSDALEAVRALRASQGREGPTRRTFYAYEGDDWRPKADAIADHAAVYGVAPELIATGKGIAALLRSANEHLRRKAEVARDKVMKAGDKREARKRSAAGNGASDTKRRVKIRKVNQQFRAPQLTPSQTPIIRHICILSTAELKRHSTWTGGLTSMSATTVPVPSDGAFAGAQLGWQIPQGDLSMVAKEGIPVFVPGVRLLVDPGAAIKPGSYVLIELDGYDELLFRVYRANRDYAPGVTFTLAALNPDYEPIKVRAKRRLKIALVSGLWGLSFAPASPP